MISISTLNNSTIFSFVCFSCIYILGIIKKRLKYRLKLLTHHKTKRIFTLITVVLKILKKIRNGLNTFEHFFKGVMSYGETCSEEKSYRVDRVQKKMC